jgi:hypothetical protein
MAENEKRDKETVEEYRSLPTDIAALAMPVAVVTAPVVNAWAKQHFSEKPKDAVQPQQQPKTD